MVMAQGFTRDEVRSIIDDIDHSPLIDDQTRRLLRFAGKITRQAYKITAEDTRDLETAGC
nr:hypothetical protein [Desulfobacterales bacterium]